MGVFEDTVVKAKDVLDSAVQKTEDMIEVQKLKFSVSNLNAKLAKDYEALGKLYYRMKTEDAQVQDEAESLCCAIEKKQEEIKKLEDKIAENKKCVVCDRCGVKNPAGSAFCSGCGQKF